MGNRQFPSHNIAHHFSVQQQLLPWWLKRKVFIFECLVFQLKCFLLRCDKGFKHKLHTMCGFPIKQLLPHKHIDQQGAERKVRV